MHKFQLSSTSTQSNPDLFSPETYSTVSNVSVGRLRRHGSESADAQADLGLRCQHMTWTNLLPWRDILKVGYWKPANFHQAHNINWCIYHRYWDPLTSYHTCPKIWTNPFHYLLRNLNSAGWVANSVDSDQMPWMRHLIWVNTVC